MNNYVLNKQTANNLIQKNVVIACQGLSKSFNDGASRIDVLHDIDFEVKAGEVCAIIGNSGSGKSTLLHLLGGLDIPTAGRIIVNGKNLIELSESQKCYIRNHCLGFIYQFHHLLPEFTALEDAAMPLLIRGQDIKQIEDKAAHLLELVGLKERMSHRPGQLSGGERQRVAVARALVTDPICILADEPTGNLDTRNAEQVFQLFLDLQTTSHASIIMVTHDVNLARKAHRALALIEGKLQSA